MAKRERVTEWPLVSIITINYNQATVTGEFLESAKCLTYPNYEIIVVDNGSTTDPSEVIERANHPFARLMKTASNLGFTGGNNAGMSTARGDYFFIVNNDTELAPDLLERLLEPFAQDERVGVVCPKIHFFDRPGVIQYAGYRPLHPYTGRTWPVGSAESDHGQHDQPGPTPFAHGCAMLIRRDVTEQVGCFDERFFLYYEELDWSERIRRAGYLIYYQPTALIRHKESLSVGKTNPLKVYYLTRNRLLFMRLHARPMQRAVFLAYFALVALPKNSLQYLLNGQFTFLKAFMRGVGWHFTAPALRPLPLASLPSTRRITATTDA